jgi:hypothetical protein
MAEDLEPAALGRAQAGGDQQRAAGLEERAAALLVDPGDQRGDVGPGPALRRRGLGDRLAAALPGAVLDALLAGEARGAGLVGVEAGLVGGDRLGGLVQRLPDAALEDEGVGLGVEVVGEGGGLLGVGQRGLEVAGRRGAVLQPGAGQADRRAGRVGGGAGRQRDGAAGVVMGPVKAVLAQQDAGPLQQQRGVVGTQAQGLAGVLVGAGQVADCLAGAGAARIGDRVVGIERDRLVEIGGAAGGVAGLQAGLAADPQRGGALAAGQRALVEECGAERDGPVVGRALVAAFADRGQRVGSARRGGGEQQQGEDGGEEEEAGADGAAPSRPRRPWSRRAGVPS